VIYRFTPLGGLAEIGSNMMYLKGVEANFIIDCGILFPDDDKLGINYLIPDFSQIDFTKTKDIIITHGHEDHIGALHHLLQKAPEMTVWAPRFAKELIEGKLERYQMAAKINEFTENDVITIGDINVHPIHVNHSIPGTYGLLIQDQEQATSSFYVSDFKVSTEPGYEKPFNFEKLKKLSKDSQTRILYADSTNILNPGRTTSETELIADIEELLKHENERIFVTLFSSNIHRLKTLTEAAAKAGRKIVCSGQSINSYLKAALAAGEMDEVKGLIENPTPHDIKNQKLLVLVAGCQGDYRSALKRLALGTDPLFKIEEGDLIAFSSKVIPGNETSVYRIQNQLTELGAEIITDRDKLIHASGHPGQKDLEILYNEYQPDTVIPIHGESLFLKRHQDFAKGFPFVKKTHLLYNFSTVLLKKDLGTRLIESEMKEPIFIHGKSIVLDKDQVRDRRKTAQNGAIHISMIHEKKNFSIKTSLIGVPNHEGQFIEQLEELIYYKIKNKWQNFARTELEEEVRIAARRFTNNILGYKPTVTVHLMDQ